MITIIFLIDNDDSDDDDDDDYYYAARCLSKDFYFDAVLCYFRLRSHLKCIEWDVKPYYTHTYSVLFCTGLTRPRSSPHRLGQAKNEIFTLTSRPSLP